MISHYSNTTLLRFFDKVIKSGNPKDCWQWTGSKDRGGYGRFTFGQRTYGAHRCSYELHKGEIPEGMCVCHSCDNPECTNPEHLFLGTQLDNVRDRTSKGRGKQQNGEKHASVKLSDSDVLKIREQVASGRKTRQVAVEFNTTHSNVCNIISRKRWSHI